METTSYDSILVTKVSKKKNRRWRLIADAKLQGNLCLRVCAYWISCQLLVFLTMYGIAMLQGPGGNSGSLKAYFVPAAFVSMLALPVALLDMIKFSNRFAGPIFNFRKRFDALANEQKTDVIHFRGGDYWGDLSENFNRLCEAIEFKQDEFKQDEFKQDEFKQDEFKQDESRPVIQPHDDPSERVQPNSPTPFPSTSVVTSPQQTTFTP